MNFLLQKLFDAAKAVVEFFRPKQFFSWQMVFLLFLFSWGMALLSVESFDIGSDSLLPTDVTTDDVEIGPSRLPPATWALFTLGWIFLIIAVGWGLAKEKFKLPFLEITIKPGIWITSALTSAFLFRVWDPATRPLAFISWPIIFALFACLSKVIVVTESKFVPPKPEVRQEMVLISLICLVLSCWIRFHFLLQDWIYDEYPVLQAGDFSESAFVVQLGPPAPVFAVAKAALRDEIGTLPLPTVRRWLVRHPEGMEALNVRFRDMLEAEDIEPLWELVLDPERIVNPQFRLNLLYLGPGDRPVIESLPAEDNLDDGAEVEQEVPRLNADGPPLSLESICTVTENVLLELDEEVSEADSEVQEESSDRLLQPPGMYPSRVLCTDPPYLVELSTFRPS